MPTSSIVQLVWVTVTLFLVVGLVVVHGNPLPQFNTGHTRNTGALPTYYRSSESLSRSLEDLLLADPSLLDLSRLRRTRRALRSVAADNSYSNSRSWSN
ncbi:hypothetical protein Pcinc_019378 [Petrolisthes cinctipes]|uniref:Uncharacterized protein n=1 Tax=Petrolisthes cinctipes TaxID=88211 RepID=A0AAE1KKG0_PETCI|nr:hypothetical protein Pcinc_019378 [Petrolisthes cinctipes]